MRFFSRVCLTSSWNLPPSIRKKRAASEEKIPGVNVHALYPQLPDNVPQWSQPAGDVFWLIRKCFDKSRPVLFAQQTDDECFL